MLEVVKGTNVCMTYVRERKVTGECLDDQRDALSTSGHARTEDKRTASESLL